MYLVVYNNCFGGFGLSEEAIIRYHEIKGKQVFKVEEDGDTYFFYEDPCGRYLDQMESDKVEGFYDCTVERHDPALVQVVQELLNKANGPFANLTIRQIQGNEYRIECYDGQETVLEPKDVPWIVIE